METKNVPPLADKLMIHVCNDISSYFSVKLTSGEVKYTVINKSMMDKKQTSEQNEMVARLNANPFLLYFVQYEGNSVLFLQYDEPPAPILQLS